MYCVWACVEPVYHPHVPIYVRGICCVCNQFYYEGRLCVCTCVETMLGVKGRSVVVTTVMAGGCRTAC